MNQLFSKYGVSIVNESYATESSLIVSLISDLENVGLQEPIAAISVCAELIESLKTAQDNFEAIHVAYEEAKVGEGTRENATTLKGVVANVINNKLIVYLRAMKLVDGETYGSFANTVSEIIEDNNEAEKNGEIGSYRLVNRCYNA